MFTVLANHSQSTMAQNINGNCRISSYILDCVTLTGSWHLPLSCFPSPPTHMLCESSLVQCELHNSWPPSTCLGRRASAWHGVWDRNGLHDWIALFTSGNSRSQSQLLTSSSTVKFLVPFIICLKITHHTDSPSSFVFCLLVARSRCQPLRLPPFLRYLSDHVTQTCFI